ncbi:MAG: hypothetical protein LBR65_08125 [Culturomica sp.]|jgi:tetratricopeptide (TPR) repeat protein|nr:hypothetical protein [Culturomica sp.]
MKRWSLFLFLLVTTTGLLGQSRADKAFDRGDYLEALKLYTKELESNTAADKDHARARVANCYFRLNDVLKAGQAYARIDENVLGVEDMLFYAIAQQRTGQYEKVENMLDVIESMGGDPAIVEYLRASCNFAKQVAKERPVYTAVKTGMDFNGVSAGATYYKGKGLVLAAPDNREGAPKDSRGYQFTRLYNAVLNSDGQGVRKLPFAEELIDEYHIGAVAFTRDLKRIYYNRVIKKEDGNTLIKLMTAQEGADGKWENIEELNINSDEYSCAHPSLYRDSLLFFASDMPGGHGGKDIYMCLVRGAECGEVVNLGASINTVEDEQFPFMDEDARLFFASSGQIGLGGLDVFVSRMLPGGEWTAPENMGRPINSSMDDFGLVFRDTDCTEGVVSSNRGGSGRVDYLFSIRKVQIREAGNMNSSDLAKRGSAEPPRRTVVPEKSRVVQQPVKEEEFVQTESADGDYRYSIQIGAFRNPVPRVYFDRMKDVKVYLGRDKLYRYTVGEYPGEPRSELGSVRRVIGDAFVVNVERYVAQQKILNDIRGDKISDEELLLIRLRNQELQEQAARSRRQDPPRQTKRFIERPVDSEMSMLNAGYTIVLMSANRVLDHFQFKGVKEVDIYELENGSICYCTGSYRSVQEAERDLSYLHRLGFTQAYVTRSDTYGLTRNRETAAGREPARENLADQGPGAALKRLIGRGNF